MVHKPWAKLPNKGDGKFGDKSGKDGSGWTRPKSSGNEAGKGKEMIN